MQPYVCGRFVDQYLIANRRGEQAAKLDEHRYRELVARSTDKGAAAQFYEEQGLTTAGKIHIINLNQV